MRTYSKYGELIKRKRLEFELTQEQLAVKANLDPKTIVSIEKGNRVNPTLKTLQKLANALKIPISDLLK